MSDLRALYDVVGDDIVLHVHVQPGAGRSAVVGRHGDALKVRVAAPPVDGRANAATVEVLSTAFAVESGAVELTSGAASRTKRFRIRGLDADEFDKRLRVAIDEAARRPAARSERP